MSDEHMEIADLVDTSRGEPWKKEHITGFSICCSRCGSHSGRIVVRKASVDIWCGSCDFSWRKQRVDPLFWEEDDEPESRR
jgi:hypothetical protein